MTNVPIVVADARMAASGTISPPFVKSHIGLTIVCMQEPGYDAHPCILNDNWDG